MGKLKTLDLRRRITDHFEQYDMDVTVKQRRGRYVVLWSDDREPIARLTRTGHEDRVRLEWWTGGEWAPYREPAESLPLDEALVEITADTDEVFGIAPEDEPLNPYELEEDLRRVQEGSVVAEHGAIHVRRFVLVTTFLAGALGGVFSDQLWAITIGPLAALLVFTLFAGIVFRSVRAALVGAILMAIPLAIAGVSAATIGSSLNQLAGGSALGIAGGLLGGATAAVLFHRGSWLAWAVGLCASILLGLRITPMLPWNLPALNTAAVAVFATLVSGVSKRLGEFLEPPPEPPEDDDE